MLTFDPKTQMSAEERRITDAFYLAFTNWREARAEPLLGQVAVIHSILDRVRSPKWWGNDVPSVVTKKLQYSSLTYTKDPQLVLYPVYDQAWQVSLKAALDVLNGEVPNPVPGADSYYAAWMDKVDPKTGKPMTPAWALAKTTVFVAQIGGHKFYNTDGNHPENVKET